MQDFIDLVCFESGFVLVDPYFLFLLGADDCFASCAEVVTCMEEINQESALRTKFLLDLIGYPLRTIAHTMNWGVSAKSGLHRAVKEALSGRVNTALERATKGQCLAALRVGKTYLCFFPVQRLAFALVGLRCINLDNRHQATVCLDNDGRFGAPLCGPTLGRRGCLKYPFGMTLCNAGYSAFAQHNPIVLNDLVHGLRKGLVSSEVGDYALQRARAATVADLGALRKRSDGFGAVSVLGLLDADVAEGGVPAEFFLPALHTPAVFMSSWEVFSTCSWAQL